MIRVANRAMVDAHIAAAFARCRAQRQRSDCAPPTPRSASSTTSQRSPTIRRCARVTVETPNGPVSLAAPPVLFSDGRAPRSGACDRRALRVDPRGIRRLRLSADAPRRLKCEADRHCPVGIQPTAGRRRAADIGEHDDMWPRRHPRRLLAQDAREPRRRRGHRGAPGLGQRCRAHEAGQALLLRPDREYLFAGTPRPVPGLPICASPMISTSAASDCRLISSHGTGLRVRLFGSLSATGKGHGTERASLAGLIGKEPATADPRFLDDMVARPDQTYPVRLGNKEFVLSLADIIYDSPKGNFPHPNTMTCQLVAGDEIIYELEYYSVGGGFIEWKGYIRQKRAAKISLRNYEAIATTR